ncbi:hypothetical protein S245_053929 [Arachis hypogaea]
MSLGNSHHWLQMIGKHIPNLTELRLSDCSLSDNDVQLLFHIHSNYSSTTPLTILDLSYLSNCSLTDTSFLVSSTSIVNSSSSLVSLDLYSNLLTSSNIFHWIFNFTANLHTLYLGYNLLEGPIPLGFDKAMKSLEYLSLSLITICKERFPISLETFAHYNHYTCHITT